MRARRRAEYEWWAHARIARHEGVPEGTIDEIRRGARPSLSDPLERTVYDFTAALVETGKVGPAVYPAVLPLLSE